MCPIKLERVAINVPDLDEAMRMFESIGINFGAVREVQQPGGTTARVALSRLGVELFETSTAATEVTVRSFHLRVDDVDRAAEEVAKKGGKLITRFAVGKMEEAICSFYGLRIVFVSYPGSDPVAAFVEG